MSEPEIEEFKPDSAIFWDGIGESGIVYGNSKTGTTWQEGKLDTEANHDGVSATLAGMSSFFDHLIAQAPEEPIQQELIDSNEPQRKEPRRTLSTINGWEAREISPKNPIEGQEWLDHFKLARRTIEDCGILILHGKRGNGKTRMAAELSRHAKLPCDRIRGRRHSPGETFTPLYRAAMSVFLEIRATYKKEAPRTEDDVVERFLDVSLLVIDELQERGESGWEDRLLTHIIDKRYRAMRPTILISNHDQNQIGASLGPSIVDRIFENGRRIEFTQESYRRRR